MAREKQPELGIKSPYDARYLITVGPCRGLDQATDPSTIADEALTKAINVRVYDGIVLCRGGQSAPLATAMQGCVQGMIDINGIGPRFVLAMVRSDTLANSSDVDMFDRQLSTPYVRITEPPTNIRLSGYPQAGFAQGSATIDLSRARYCYKWWNEQVIFPGATDLWRFIFPEDNLSVDTVQVEQLFKLQVPNGAAFEVASMETLAQVSDNAITAGQPDPLRGPPLYFGTIGGGIFAYIDGRLVQLQADGTFTERVLVFRYHDRIYGASTQQVMYQNGWSDGLSLASTSFTTPAMPGGTADFKPMCAIEFGGVCLIGGSDTGVGKILKIDDSSGTPVITVAHTGAGGYVSFDDFAEALGAFYVAYRYKPSATKIAEFSVVDQTGAVGGPLSGLNWSEDAMIPRILGTGEGLYISAWSDSLGDSAIYCYDGSSTTKLSNVVGATGAEHYSPWDMIGF